MDTQLFDYLLTVAKHLSFTKAAEELYTSQSSVSKHIAKLEKELDVTFFDRSNRQIVMTEEGKQLIDCITLCKNSFDLTLEQIRAKKISKDTIRLGIINGWDLSKIILPALQQFKSKYPTIKIDIISDGMFVLIDKYMQGDLDIIFSIEDAFLSKDSSIIHHFGSVKNVLLFSKNSPQAQKENLTLEDFNDLPLYHQGPFQSIHRKFYKTAPFHSGMESKEFPSWDSLLMAVSNGWGYCICNELFRELNSSLFMSIDLPLYDNVILVNKKSENLQEYSFLINTICQQYVKTPCRL